MEPQNSHRYRRTSDEGTTRASEAQEPEPDRHDMAFLDLSRTRGRQSRPWRPSRVRSVEVPADASYVGAPGGSTRSLVNAAAPAGVQASAPSVGATAMYPPSSPWPRTKNGALPAPLPQRATAACRGAGRPSPIRPATGAADTSSSNELGEVRSTPPAQADGRWLAPQAYGPA
jgi:hypothetical protein